MKRLLINIEKYLTFRLKSDIKYDLDMEFIKGVALNGKSDLKFNCISPPSTLHPGISPVIFGRNIDSNNSTIKSIYQYIILKNIIIENRSINLLTCGG